MQIELHLNQVIYFKYNFIKEVIKVFHFTGVELQIKLIILRSKEYIQRQTFLYEGINLIAKGSYTHTYI